MKTTKLIKGRQYAIESLKFDGWSDGCAHPEYNVFEYFDAENCYLGSDTDGIEPTFAVTTDQVYDVFRAENRAGGWVDHLGTVEMPDEESALVEAKAAFECKKTHHLFVAPAPKPDAD